MASIFSTLNTSKMGMSVHQGAINTTSHNVANASTTGFSRQRVNIVTNRPISLGGEAGQVGTGAQIAAIERVRDSFVDYQVRVESSELGKYSVKSDYLSQVEGIFNEPSDTSISTTISEFFDAFQELSKQSTSSSTKVVVAQKAQALCDILNSTYRKLETLQINTQTNIQSSIKEVNSILDQIATLNDQIRVVTITGDTPNDLMDTRDLLIDKLSSKFNIQIDKKQFNGNNVLAEDLAGSNIAPLVNSAPNGDYTRLSYISSMEQQADGSYEVTYFVNGDTNKQETVMITDLSEEDAALMQKYGIILTDANGQVIDSNGQAVAGTVSYNDLTLLRPAKGELAGCAEVQDSIQSYMDQLDKMANALALSVNTIYSGEDVENADNLFFVVSGTDTEKGITAKNISIKKEIIDNPSIIKTGKDENSGEGDGSRALAIAGLKNTLLNIASIGNLTREELFANGIFEFGDADNLSLKNDKNGTKVESYFQDIIDKLGVESQYASRVQANQEELLGAIELNRLSISGVSLDEEMTNLIQFQQAYSANAKVISTVSDMLDVILGLV